MRTVERRRMSGIRQYPTQWPVARAVWAQLRRVPKGWSLNARTVSLAAASSHRDTPAVPLAAGTAVRPGDVVNLARQVGKRHQRRFVVSAVLVGHRRHEAFADDDVDIEH